MKSVTGFDWCGLYSFSSIELLLLVVSLVVEIRGTKIILIRILRDSLHQLHKFETPVDQRCQFFLDKFQKFHMEGQSGVKMGEFGIGIVELETHIENKIHNSDNDPQSPPVLVKVFSCSEYSEHCTQIKWRHEVLSGFRLSLRLTPKGTYLRSQRVKTVVEKAKSSKSKTFEENDLFSRLEKSKRILGGKPFH